MGHDLKALSVSAAQSANAQIAASVKKEARLRLEVAAYQKVAFEAKKGSVEQVHAARMAADAQVRLSRSLGVTAREARELASAARTADREFSRFGRGAVAGSGALGGLGRVALSASAGFIGGAGLVYALRKSISAAVEQDQVLANLGNSLRAQGFSWEEYGNKIETATAKTKVQSAFDDEELFKSLQLLVRGVHDVDKALMLNSLAADIARGRNMDLVKSAQLLVRVNAGQVGSLRRLGIDVEKGAKGWEAIMQVQKAYAGAAEAFTESAIGAQTSLTVAIDDTAKAIGRALLPTVQKYEIQLARYLGSAERQEKLQHEIEEIVNDTVKAVEALAHVFKEIAGPISDVNRELGGLSNTVETLVVGFAAFKISKWALGLAGVTTAATATAGGLAGVNKQMRLLRLASIAPIIFTVEVIGLKAVANKIEALQTQQLEAESVGVSDEVRRRFVPKLAARWEHLRKTHPAFAAKKSLEAVIEGTIGGTELQIADLVADAIAYSTGSGPVRAEIDAMNRKKKPKPEIPKPEIEPSRLNAMDKIQLAISSARLAVARGDAGAEGQLVSALQDQIAFSRKYQKIQEGLIERRVGDLGQHAEIIAKLRGDEASALGEIASIHAAAQSKRDADNEAAKAARIKAAQKEKREREAAIAAAQKERKDALSARQVAQFRALGLSDVGSEKVPMAGALRKQLDEVKKGLKGTILDTDQNTHLLTQIGKVLDDQFGKLTTKTRASVKELLDALQGELPDKKPILGKMVTSQQLTAGLGLSTDMRKVAEQRIAQALAHGGRVPRGMGVQGIASSPVTVNVHGVTDPDKVARKVIDVLDRRKLHSPTQNSGIHAGRAL